MSELKLERGTLEIAAALLLFGDPPRPRLRGDVHGQDT